jgi:hypothetical protein
VPYLSKDCRRLQVKPFVTFNTFVSNRLLLLHKLLTVDLSTRRRFVDINTFIYAPLVITPKPSHTQAPSACPQGPQLAL